MKRKTIDAIHEVRMTIVQIVIPAGVAAFAIDGRYPDLKYKIRDKYVDIKTDVKNRVNNVFKKEESE